MNRLTLASPSFFLRYILIFAATVRFCNASLIRSIALVFCGKLNLEQHILVIFC
jgi:hypothetical protein